MFFYNKFDILYRKGDLGDGFQDEALAMAAMLKKDALF